MSEARLLSMLTSYPHPTALARHVRDGRMFGTLRRLEARGLVTKRRGTYLLTKRGRDELELTEMLTRLIARAAVGQCKC
jgi:DNA-binding PadR family transcriptional regulator